MDTYLGIEFGSTRIKAVLIGENAEVLATGGHTWENEWKDGIWTYSLDAIQDGLAACYSDLAAAYRATYGKELTEVSAMGISGMMHGYVVTGEEDALLAPFRTWRNTNAAPAAEALSARFGRKIPMRWTIAQLYESILEDMPHVRDIRHLTTLAGYVHHRLTGEWVLGMNEASGVFPLDAARGTYREELVTQFEQMAAERGYPICLREILPAVLPAGRVAGRLTEEGIALLGADCHLRPGIPFCPPEGDAGTGMTATGCVRPRTGNVSAGTSVFTMVVLEEENTRLSRKFDTVTTPDGKPVVLVQCNNFTSDINAYAALFAEFAATAGLSLSAGQVFDLLFRAARDGSTEGLLNFNFLSGEPTVGLSEGRPLFLRTPGSLMTLGGFMKTQIYSSLAAFAIGMKELTREQVAIDRMLGHGGFFKTPVVGQTAMSAALRLPITVAETAGEGGAWGVAVLASYLGKQVSLADYLDGIFADAKTTTLSATQEEQSEFAAFLARFRAALPVEQAAVRFAPEA